MKLERRVADLEARTSSGSVEWVRVIQDCGQTERQAIAAHEAEHGPIGDSNIVLRVITKPGTSAAHA